MQKKLAVIVVLLLIGIVGMGCGTETVATVNGEKVTQPQLEKIINLYVAQAKQVYGTDVTEDQEFMGKSKNGLKRPHRPNPGDSECTQRRTGSH